MKNALGGINKMDELLKYGDLVLIRYSDPGQMRKVSGLRGEVIARNSVAIRIRAADPKNKLIDYVVPWTSVIDVEVLQEAAE